MTLQELVLRKETYLETWGATVEFCGLTEDIVNDPRRRWIVNIILKW